MQGNTSRGRHTEAGACISDGTAPEVVYTFQITQAQAVLFHLESDYDGALYLRSTCDDPSPASELACNDDDGDTRHSYIGRYLQPGRYFLFVDGYNASAGAFTLTSRMEGDCLRGDAEACNQMGYIYLQGNGTSVNCDAATEAFSRACDGGNDRACNRLALLSEVGECLPEDGDVARRYYSRSCEGGFAIACSNNGRLLEGGRAGIAVDQAGARSWYSRGCDGGDLEGCGSAARLARQASQFADAMRFARLGCSDEVNAARDGTACNQLGLLYGEGQGTVRNLNRAAQFYEMACALNQLYGCNNLGDALLAGSGTGADPNRAREMFERACSAEANGVRVGCRGLASLYRDGRGGVERDPARARQLLEMGCSSQDGLACNQLGLLCYRQQPRDIECARDGFERACNEDDPAGCGNLGVLYDEGTGVTADPTRAAQLLRQACEHGDRYSCPVLASHLESGSGIPADAERAVSLYREACEGANPIYSACANLGRIYAEGRIVIRDDPRAIGLYQLACEHNIAAGCYGVGTFLLDGRGAVARDRQRAAQYLDRACRGEDARACSALRGLQATPSPAPATH